MSDVWRWDNGVEMTLGFRVVGTGLLARYLQSVLVGRENGLPVYRFLVPPPGSKEVDFGDRSDVTLWAIEVGWSFGSKLVEWPSGAVIRADQSGDGPPGVDF